MGKLHIDQLEKELKKVITNKPVKLDVCTVIQNPVQFMENHIKILRGQSGNQRYKPYYNRLVKLLEFYQSHKK